jgi:hypothetical protein
MKQQPYADCQRNETEKPNPTVWYGENSQPSGQTDAQDGRETNVQTGHNAARRNSSGKEQSQQKGIVNVRGSERSQACRQNR